MWWWWWWWLGSGAIPPPPTPPSRMRSLRLEPARGPPARTTSLKESGRGGAARRGPPAPPRPQGAVARQAGRGRAPPWLVRRRAGRPAHRPQSRPSRVRVAADSSGLAVNAGPGPMPARACGALAAGRKREGAGSWERRRDARAEPGFPGGKGGVGTLPAGRQRGACALARDFRYLRPRKRRRRH